MRREPSPRESCWRPQSPRDPTDTPHTPSLPQTRLVSSRDLRLSTDSCLGRIVEPRKPWLHGRARAERFFGSWPPQSACLPVDQKVRAHGEWHMGRALQFLRSWSLYSWLTHRGSSETVVAGPSPRSRNASSIRGLHKAPASPDTERPVPNGESPHGMRPPLFLCGAGRCFRGGGAWRCVSRRKWERNAHGAAHQVSSTTTRSCRKTAKPNNETCAPLDVGATTAYTAHQSTPTER